LDILNDRMLTTAKAHAAAAVFPSNNTFFITIPDGHTARAEASTGTPAAGGGPVQRHEDKEPDKDGEEEDAVGYIKPRAQDETIDATGPPSPCNIIGLPRIV